MSTDTATAPDTTTDEATEPVPAGLSLREQHAIMGRLTAFQSMIKDRVDAFRAQYGDALYELYEETGTKAVTHSFGDNASVTFTLKSSSDRFEVEGDGQAFTDFVEENFPSEVEYVVKVRDSFQKALFKRLEVQEDGTIIDTQEGLEVEGVKFVKGGSVSRTFQSSWTGGENAKAMAVNDALAHLGDLAITAGGDE